MVNGHLLEAIRSTTQRVVCIGHHIDCDASFLGCILRCRKLTPKRHMGHIKALLGNVEVPCRGVGDEVPYGTQGRKGKKSQQLIDSSAMGGVGAVGAVCQGTGVVGGAVLR